MSLAFLSDCMPTPDEEVVIITLTHDMDDLPAEFERINEKILYRLDTMKNGIDCESHNNKRGVSRICIEIFFLTVYKTFVKSNINTSLNRM